MKPSNATAIIAAAGFIGSKRVLSEVRVAPFTAHNLQFIALIGISPLRADLQAQRVGRYVLDSPTTDLINAFPLTERR